MYVIKMKKNLKSSKKSRKKKKVSSSTYQLRKQKENEIQKRLRNDEDFIISKEHDNSINTFIKQGKRAKEYEIAEFLQLTILEVNKIFKESLKKIKYFIQE